METEAKYIEIGVAARFGKCKKLAVVTQNDNHKMVQTVASRQTIQNQIKEFCFQATKLTVFMLTYMVSN